MKTNSNFGKHIALQPAAEDCAKILISTAMANGFQGPLAGLENDDMPTPDFAEIMPFIRTAIDAGSSEITDVRNLIHATDMPDYRKELLSELACSCVIFAPASTPDLAKRHLDKLRDFIEIREEQFAEWRGNPTGSTIDLIGFPNSDAGNAERLHALHGRNIRYVSNSGQWLVWDSNRWMPDSTGQLVRMFIETMRCAARLATEIKNPAEAQLATRFALKSTNRPQVDAGIALAQSIAGVSISITDLDADPWIVGCPNGVIDLRQGRDVRPTRGQHVTKSIGTKYDPHATCPTWEKFLQTVTRGDSELIGFLQSAVGYTLTGQTSEQCLFFLHGAGQNGKGVFSETIKRLAGDYGQTAPESLFTKDKPGGATNDIARLTGCRMAIASELDEGAAFAESRIKALTGSDTITARFLHQEFFDFRPTHKFWISGNHKPAVKGTDFGIWRRIRLIPFTVRIPDEEKDPNLADKLAVELPGILNWSIAGCLRWQREGLRVPSCVTQATESYRREEDVIGQFLTDCTEEQAGARTLTTSVYQAYGQWAAAEGIQERYRLNSRRLIRRIEEHGFSRMKSHGVPVWETLILKDPAA
jgi:putative DNA primase/helicase